MSSLGLKASRREAMIDARRSVAPIELAGPHHRVDSTSRPSGSGRFNDSRWLIVPNLDVSVAAVDVIPLREGKGFASLPAWTHQQRHGAMPESHNSDSKRDSR